MEFESVVTELYALRPEEFVAARDGYADRARKAGDREQAGRIRRLRRPSLAAWATNLLVRRKSQEVHKLLDLGEQLREAHRTLDSGQLQQLGHQQHLVIASMAREAQKLAREAGRKIGDGAVREVESTLHAAVADAEAADRLASGCLSQSLTPPTGLPAVDRKAPEPTPPSKPAGREDRESRELEAARVAADEAEATARTRAAERREADEAAEAAEGELGRCDEQVAALRSRLEEAEHLRSEAGDRLEAARARAREAATAERTARGEAEKLARRRKAE